MLIIFIFKNHILLLLNARDCKAETGWTLLLFQSSFFHMKVTGGTSLSTTRDAIHESGHWKKNVQNLVVDHLIDALHVLVSSLARVGLPCSKIKWTPRIWISQTNKCHNLFTRSASNKWTSKEMLHLAAQCWHIWILHS